MHTVCMQGTESATESLHARQGIALRVPMRYRVQHRTQNLPRAGGRENKISVDLETAARGSSSQACK